MNRTTANSPLCPQSPFPDGENIASNQFDGTFLPTPWFWFHARSELAGSFRTKGIGVDSSKYTNCTPQLAVWPGEIPITATV